MPRPTTKSDLIQAANEQFAKLWTLIGEMSDKEKSADIVPNERDKTTRDVLVHLYEWHGLLLNWLMSNTKGKPEAFVLSDNFRKQNTNTCQALCMLSHPINHSRNGNKLCRPVIGFAFFHSI